jgi:hypothetical protein
VPPATPADNAAKFSRRERSIQTFARRRANRQLMQVPWTRFRRAYDRYPRWQALLLWTQAIIATQGGVSPWLVEELRKRCPGLLEHDVRKPKVTDLGLLQWIHNQQFGCAKRQGWLDALTFYGVRHPRSECAWAYWERCDKEWSSKQPSTLPAFDQWWQQARQMGSGHKVRYVDLVKAVERYLNWEALLWWLRPLSHAYLPPHVTSELKRKCPGIFKNQNSRRFQGAQKESKIWRQLLRKAQENCLSDAKQAGWLDAALKLARSHPLHVRLLLYGKRWAKAWPRNRTRAYPSFRQWRQAAEGYVEVRREPLL